MTKTLAVHQITRSSSIPKRHVPKRHVGTYSYSLFFVLVMLCPAGLQSLLPPMYHAPPMLFQPQLLCRVSGAFEPHVCTWTAPKYQRDMKPARGTPGGFWRGTHFHLLSMRFDDSATGGALDDPRAPGGSKRRRGVAKVKRQATGRRTALDPLRYAGGSTNNVGLKRSPTGQKAGGPAPRAKVEEEWALKVTETDVKRQVFAVTHSGQVEINEHQNQDTGKQMPRVVASSSDEVLALNDTSSQRLAQRRRKSAQRVTRRGSTAADADTDAASGNLSAEVFGVELAGQIAEVQRLLSCSPMELSNARRIASGTLLPRQSWSAGPAVLLQQLLRAALLLTVVVRQTALLTALVLGLAFRTGIWVCDWAIRIGDAKEWWIPEAAERLVKLRADAKHSRAPVHLRVARSKLRALLLLVYTNIAAALSPELVASIEASLLNLRDVLFENAAAWLTTVRRALVESSLSDDGEPQTVLPASNSSSPRAGASSTNHSTNRGGASSSSGGGSSSISDHSNNRRLPLELESAPPRQMGLAPVRQSEADGGSITAYTSLLDQTRDRSTARLTVSILGANGRDVDLCGSMTLTGTPNVSEAQLLDSIAAQHAAPDARAYIDAAARGYVHAGTPETLWEEWEWGDGSSAQRGRLGSSGSRLGSGRSGSMTRKRDATVLMVQNVTGAIGSTWSVAVEQLQGLSQAVDVEGLGTASLAWARDKGTRALSAAEGPKNATISLSVNASLALWGVAEGPLSNAGSWVAGVLSGQNADMSSMAERVHTLVDPWGAKVGDWWSGLEAGISKVDPSVNKLVADMESLSKQVFSMTVNTAAAVPGFQAAEEWIRGNEFGWTNYLKVQRWWHQCILFCTPKWEAFEKWAKDAKVPYFARRVLSNAVFYRISYLRWLVGLAAAEMLFARSTAALVMLVLSLLSAAVVRSNLLALEAAQQAREAEQRAGGLRVAGVAALSSLFGKSPEAKLREAAAEKKLQDKSQLAAGLAVLAVIWGTFAPTDVLRNLFLLVVGHAFLHAQQKRSCPMPVKVSNYGGQLVMGVRIQVSPMDIFRAEPTKGALSPPSPPAVGTRSSTSAVNPRGDDTGTSGSSRASSSGASGTSRASSSGEQMASAASKPLPPSSATPAAAKSSGSRKTVIGTRTPRAPTPPAPPFPRPGASSSATAPRRSPTTTPSPPPPPPV